MGGERRGLSAPGASAEAAPSRAGALPGAAGRRRAAIPATAGPVVARRHAAPGTAPEHQPGAGVAGVPRRA